MQYRRFGRTGISMPVFSCGGMRFQQSWSELEPEAVERKIQSNLESVIERALELGINHIETARGYGSSEMQLGWILPRLPREKLIVQTKVAPSEDPEQFRQTFERSMSCLKLEHVDLLSFHGVNTSELLHWVLRKGGCLEAARKIQRDGRARFIGFSTHAPTRVIRETISSGEFDYVNVHWYFVNDLNWPAIEDAARHDMGVFIISPSDKGGQLYNPPAKLVELCKPLSPMQFNDLYCLARPQVHTLSLGAASPTDFDEHVSSLRYYGEIRDVVAPIEKKLRDEISRSVGHDWAERWSTGIPSYDETPGNVNLQEILRLWTFSKALDLDAWARGRYNMLGSGGHWQPGQNAVAVEEALLTPAFQQSPFADRIPAILKEAHELLHGEAQQRLSQSES